MKLYVVRHGESETNRRGYWTGWLDVALTDKGLEDAKRAGEVIGGVAFDKVYSSDLIRARKTAETALPDCSYEATPLLREINVGDIAGKPLTVMTPEMRKIAAEFGYGDMGGESTAQLNGRIREFMEQVESLDCENVAAFSHAGWLRGMLDQVVGIRLPRKSIICGNCTVAVFDYTDGVWRLHSWINVT